MNIAIPREKEFARCAGLNPSSRFWLIDKFSRARHEVRPSSSDGQQGTLGPGLRRLIPVVVVLIPLMAVTSFFYKSRKDQLAKENPAQPPNLPPHQSRSSQKHCGRPIVHNPVGGVQQVVTGKLGTTLTATSEQMKLEKTLLNDTSSTIQSEEFSTSLRQSWEPHKQPTQRKKLILSSCGRRSSEEA